MSDLCGMNSVIMSMVIEAVALFSLVGLLNASSDTPEEISVLESLTGLLSNRPSHLPWIPSVAYETMPKNEYQQQQFIKDRKYERQMELILADLQVHLSGNGEARKFFIKAAVYGMPSSDNLKFYENFLSSYDNRLKQPGWALEHLTDKHFTNKTAVRGSRSCRFLPDMTLHSFFRASYSDYRSSYYERCQFAPACDNRIKQLFLDRSYHYSNIAPQTRNLNRKGIWRRLECYVAFLAWRTRNVYVVTGAVFRPYFGGEDLRYRVLGFNRIAVPTDFFKVILYEDTRGDLLMEAFIVPNSIQIGTNERLERFRIDIDKLDKLEDLTGLKFFDVVDRSWVFKPLGLQYRFEEKCSGVTAY